MERVEVGDSVKTGMSMIVQEIDKKKGLARVIWFILVDKEKDMWKKQDEWVTLESLTKV
jgi:hypothetical protein